MRSIFKIKILINNGVENNFKESFLSRVIVLRNRGHKDQSPKHWTEGSSVALQLAHCYSTIIHHCCSEPSCCCLIYISLLLLVTCSGTDWTPAPGQARRGFRRWVRDYGVGARGWLGLLPKLTKWGILKTCCKDWATKKLAVSFLTYK